MSDRFLRAGEVFRLAGIGRTLCYALIKRGEFPKPIRLGERISVWSAEEIAEWQRQMMENRTHKLPTTKVRIGANGCER